MITSGGMLQKFIKCGLNLGGGGGAYMYTFSLLSNYTSYHWPHPLLEVGAVSSLSDYETTACLDINEG